MSIQLKNEIRELNTRVELLERKVNIISPEVRSIAGQPDPGIEKPVVKIKKKRR